MALITVVLLLVYGALSTCVAPEDVKVSRILRFRRQAVGAEAGCTLPPPQQNGKFAPSKARCPPDKTYSVHSLCRMTPGNLVPHNWPLFHSCDLGYALNATNPASVCLNGQWRPPLPSCVQVDVHQDQDSPTFKEVSVNGIHQGINDTHQGVNETHQGANETHQGANETHEGMNDTHQGANGTHEVVSCGMKTQQGEFPWAAAIYNLVISIKWELICSGTLITPHIVLTAAGCLKIHSEYFIPLHEIKVGLGKHYRDFKRSEPSSIISDVKELIVYKEHSGSSSSDLLDIGLIDLVESVKVTSSIMPACVDWSHAFRPDVGAVGTVAGWTKGTRLNDPISSVKINYVGFNECLKRFDDQKSLSNDGKLCAKLNSYLDSTDQFSFNGGGMTFVNGSGQHFVIGMYIADARNSDWLLSLDLQHREYISWLKNTIARLKEDRQEP